MNWTENERDREKGHGVRREDSIALVNIDIAEPHLSAYPENTMSSLEEYRI